MHLVMLWNKITQKFEQICALGFYILEVLDLESKMSLLGT